MDLPIFEMVIDETVTSEIEVAAVAFVDKPAIERNFLAFNKQLLFAVSEEKRIVSGPAMIADQLIYRKDENGEYNVFFSKDTIKQIALKFFKKDYQKNLNLFHDPNLPLEGVTIFESFISDSERGIQPMKGFEDCPDGTWFISAKVENEDVWNKIKSGEVKGFSVEGVFSYMKKGKMSIEERVYQLLSGAKDEEPLFSEMNFMDFKGEFAKMRENIKQLFFTPAPVSNPAPAPAPAQAQAAYQLKDGTEVSITELAAGGVVTVGNAPAPSGELELADGTKLMIGEGGVITAVAGGAPAAPPNFESQFAEINSKFEAYEQRFTEQADAYTKLSESFNKTNETIVHLVGIVEKMAQQPTADPSSNSPNNFSTHTATDKEKRAAETQERLENLTKNLKELKKN